MNTIKIFLAESGRIADLRKDFPLYQGQYQNKLLNVFVPTSILAPNFSVQEDGNTIADYVSSTAVKIGMKTIERNGKIHISKTYYMRYLKTLTYQNVEYALYERKLPREFTFYAGQGVNAPELITNVVNIDNETTPATIIEITTSQVCNLDVMPSSYLDQDEPIEATALEEINSRLNEIDEDLAKKQNIHDDTLETTAKTIVGAINENKSRIDVNTQDIETNRKDIATNRNDISFLIQNMQISEDYIGQLEGETLPSQSQLTTFVRNNTEPSREPKNGDVVIFILKIAGETDKNYKYFYTATGWQGYEIPPIEMAHNGSLGVVEGTYAVGSTNDTLVDISGGQILNIYVKDEAGTYRNIREYMNTNKSSIDDIIDGTSVVGEAMKALEDGLGNNIVNTYLTKTLGATKDYVRDYAMPREFNDVDFISASGYQDDVPTTPADGVQFTTTTNAVGDFQLFQISKTNTADFELSAKNGYSNNIYVSASADCKVTFRLTTQYKKFGQDWADLNIELTSPINLTAGDIEKVMFGNPFTLLEEKVITLTDGDMIRQILEVVTQTSSAITFGVYSNEIYPSTFNLTSQSYVLSGVEQSVSRLIMLGADGVIEANKVVYEVQNADSYVEFRTNQREFLINALLPIVGELDDTLPVYITFGDTTYGVYSFMKGSATPITIGDLKSNMTYDQNIGYSFTSKMIYLETSDYRGFAISPATITAEQLVNIIEDTQTVVVSLNNNGTKFNIQLSAEVVNKLARTLVTPISTPSKTELVGVDSQNMQTMIELGRGLSIVNGVLTMELDNTLAPFVSYLTNQNLSSTEKATARANIDADITAEKVFNIIDDTSTIVASLDNTGLLLNIQLSADVVNKLARTLVTPMSRPTNTELVGVDNQNMQTMIELGNGLILQNGALTIQLNDSLAPFISYAVAQSLTEEQKAQARANIGAGSSAFSGSYPDLQQKPILNTSNTTSQTAQSNEIIDGTINLHKISKTGALADVIQDTTHRTVTDAEKTTWNNKSNFDGSFTNLTNVPTASTSQAGIIQIATDNDVIDGTSETKTVTPKQLKSSIPTNYIESASVEDNTLLLTNKDGSTTSFPGQGSPFATISYSISATSGQVKALKYMLDNQTIFKKGVYIVSLTPSGMYISGGVKLKQAKDFNVKITAYNNGDNVINGYSINNGTISQVIGPTTQEIGKDFIVEDASVVSILINWTGSRVAGIKTIGSTGSLQELVINETTVNTSQTPSIGNIDVVQKEQITLSSGSCTVNYYKIA